jgi:hypothetical protein
VLLRADLVGPTHAGLVDKAIDRTAAQDVRGENLRKIRLLDPRIPDILWIDDDHGAMAALGEAAGLVDAHLDLLAGLSSRVPENLHVFLSIALRRAGLTARTHEHVTIVLAHHGSSMVLGVPIS